MGIGTIIQVRHPCRDADFRLTGCHRQTHAIRVLPERSAAKDPRKNLLLLSDDTSEHVYTMVEELAPDGYLVAESITFKVMQMNDALVVFVWQDGGWQKSSEGYLAMYDERTDTPVPLVKTFPQTGSIL